MGENEYFSKLIILFREMLFIIGSGAIEQDSIDDRFDSKVFLN